MGNKGATGGEQQSSQAVNNWNEAGGKCEIITQQLWLQNNNIKIIFCAILLSQYHLIGYLFLIWDLPRLLIFVFSVFFCRLQRFESKAYFSVWTSHVVKFTIKGRFMRKQWPVLIFRDNNSLYFSTSLCLHEWGDGLIMTDWDAGRLSRSITGDNGY